MRGANICILPLLNDPLCGPHCVWSRGCDGFGGLEGLGQKVVRFEDAVCEPDALRFFGDQVLARARQLFRPRDTHAANQAARSAEAGDQAELDFGLAKARLG